VSACGLEDVRFLTEEGVFSPTVCPECFWVARSLVSWLSISHNPPCVDCNQGLVLAVVTVCYRAGAVFF
jgi:hypothetical protein